MDADFLLELLTYEDPTTGQQRTAGLASLSDEVQPPTKLHSCITVHSFVQNSTYLLGCNGQTIEPNWFHNKTTCSEDQGN